MDNIISINEEEYKGLVERVGDVLVSVCNERGIAYDRFADSVTEYIREMSKKVVIYALNVKCSYDDPKLIRYTEKLKKSKSFISCIKRDENTAALLFNDQMSATNAFFILMMDRMTVSRVKKVVMPDPETGSTNI